MDFKGYQNRFAADDWGLSEGINDAIIELALSGKLYSVSLMANSEFLNYRLDELLRISSPRWALHLNLTEGRAISSLDSSSGLVDGSGMFQGQKRLWLNIFWGALSPAAVVAEFKAQWGQLESLGVNITEINGHHHVHQLPRVYRILEKEILKKENVSLRVMADPSHLASYIMGRRLSWAADSRVKRTSHMYITKPAKREDCLDKMKKHSGRPFVLHPSRSLRSMEPFEQRRVLDFEFARGF